LKTKTTVSLITCPDYGPAVLEQAILRGLDNIGFDFARFKGARTALKPNFLTAAPVEKAVTTHPEFIRATARVVKDHGGIPVIMESPSTMSLDRFIKKTPYREIIESEGIELADTADSMELPCPLGETYRSFLVSRAFDSADLILNLPKLKTHALTYITGAVKNLYGMIPGFDKAKWHIRARNRDRFAGLLLDFYSGVLDRFGDRTVHIVDGIMGMEGEGPGTGGNPRKLDLVLAGHDGVAVDFIAANLLKLDLSLIKTITDGRRRGLGLASFDDIRLTGDDFNGAVVSDFIPPDFSPGSGLIGRIINIGLLRKLFIDRPVPSMEKCTLCYECKKICPAGAISPQEKSRGVPLYDYDICIRCYCCKEVCPEGASQKKNGPLQGLLK